MTEERTAMQPPESDSRQSAEAPATGELAAAQARELATQVQSVEEMGQSEAEKTAAGQKASILTGDGPQEQTEQETEEGKPAQSETDGAPEEYADFKVPEAFKLEDQDLTDFKSFAKEQDLTQEQAQKVLDFAGPKIKEMIEQPYKAWNELQMKWQEEVKADPEIGGTKYEQSVKEAGNVFMPSESNPFVKSDAEANALRAALNATGAGNNPAIVRLFVKMGRLLAEPGHLARKPAPQSRQDALLNSMYPTMNGE